MKKLTKLFLVVLVICLALGCFVACDDDNPCANGHNYQNGVCTVCGAADPNSCTNGHNFKYGTCTVCGATDPDFEPTDYVSQLKLNTSSGTAQLDATVKAYIDGDTTHFYVDDPAFEGGVLKARYLAINTPESTGKIEPYGKTASNFTKEKLKNAVAIRVESDTSTWSADSTGSRYLCWVWYKAEENGDWRNLNLEILQEGLAIASNTSQNRYGETCMAALNQAQALKLYCHSGQPDPNMYYGSAIEVTLRELRTNIAAYEGKKVAFEGTIIINNGDYGVYVQAYDEETDSYNGIFVYYGFGAKGQVTEALKPGNTTRIVGTCSYYETGGTYQISGLSYNVMKPNDPENTQIVTKGNMADVPYTEITADDLLTRKINVDITTEVDGEEKVETVSMDYSQFIYNTAVEMKNLTVVNVYTTTAAESSSKGAMTLTCKTADGKTVTIRTIVLKDSNNKLVTADYFQGKTINVKGIVESFNGDIQIKLHQVSDVTFVD